MTETQHFLLAHSVKILTTAPFLQVQWAESRCSVGWAKAFCERSEAIFSKVTSSVDKSEIWSALFPCRAAFQQRLSLLPLPEQCCSYSSAVSLPRLILLQSWPSLDSCT